MALSEKLGSPIMENRVSPQPNIDKVFQIVIRVLMLYLHDLPSIFLQMSASWFRLFIAWLENKIICGLNMSLISNFYGKKKVTYQNSASLVAWTCGVVVVGTKQQPCHSQLEHKCFLP